MRVNGWVPGKEERVEGRGGDSREARGEEGRVDK